MTRIYSTTKLIDLRKITNLLGRLPRQCSMPGFCSQEEFHSVLAREKARADRNGHGFSLVAVEISRKEDASMLVKKLQKKIRTADDIGWFDHNTLGILLYNTSAVGAWQFVNKNNKKGEVFAKCQCSVYSYPNEWCGF